MPLGAPLSLWPAKRAFSRLGAMGRIKFSTLLLSILRRPSVRKPCSEFPWVRMQASFAPRRDIMAILRRCIFLS